MDDEPEKNYPLTPAKMSKVPSWISVGFVVGLLAGWSLHPEPELAVPAAPVAAPAPKPSPPTSLMTIEAVFASCGNYAIWSEDDHTTEVAFWSFDRHEYSEYYEVKRIGETLYFRSIPRLTRSLVDYGERLPSDCLLRFTAPYKFVPRREAPVPPPATSAPMKAENPVPPTAKVQPPLPARTPSPGK